MLLISFLSSFSFPISYLVLIQISVELSFCCWSNVTAPFVNAFVLKYFLLVFLFQHKKRKKKTKSIIKQSRSFINYALQQMPWMALYHFHHHAEKPNSR
jgi:hypothetical protein